MTAGARSGQGPSPLGTGITGPETPDDSAEKPNSIPPQHHELLSTSHFSSPILYTHGSSWGLNLDPTGEEAAHYCGPWFTKTDCHYTAWADLDLTIFLSQSPAVLGCQVCLWPFVSNLTWLCLPKSPCQLLFSF